MVSRTPRMCRQLDRARRSEVKQAVRRDPPRVDRRSPSTTAPPIEAMPHRTSAADAVRRALSLSREALVGPAEVGDVATGLTTATGPEL
jgi:hypothetical protein